MSQLLASWRSRSRSAHLVRYEDLIRRPNDVLRELLNFLGLDNQPEMLNTMQARAAVDTERSRAHRTSEQPLDSVERWRREPDQRLANLCQDILGDILEGFGYSLTAARPDVLSQCAESSIPTGREVVEAPRQKRTRPSTNTAAPSVSIQAH